MDNQNYTIAENFTLPSHGLVYNEEINPEVKLRSMTVRDEMKRCGSPNDGTIYKNMAEIIDNCLVQKPGISVYDMCIGDYQFLMYKLRVVTYGSDYLMECKCPLCGDVAEHHVDIDSLELNELKDFDPKQWLELILPVCKKKILLNITTPRILDNIEKDVKRIIKQYNKEGKIASENDWRLLYQLMYAINTIDDQKLNMAQKEQFCNNLVGRDFNAIINKLNALDNKIGLGDTVQIHCDNCGFDMPVSFRVTDEFFRPSSIS